MLHAPSKNQVWLNRCLASLRNEPINVHHCDWVEGDIRAARAAGFSRGDSEFVSFVDNDDTVVPGAFGACIEALDANPGVCGVYTTSSIMKEVNGIDVVVGMVHPYRPWKSTTIPSLTEIHQLVVMRRSAVTQIITDRYYEIPKMVPTEVWIYWAMAQRAPWLAIHRCGYNWRMHKNNAHIIDANESDIKRTYQMISDSWTTS